MTKEQALEKYPNLESLSTMELILLQSEARKVNDKDFFNAILTLLSPNKEENGNR